MSGVSISAWNAFLDNPYQAVIFDENDDGRLAASEITAIVDGGIKAEFGIVTQGIIRAVEAFYIFDGEGPPTEIAVDSSDFNPDENTIIPTFDALFGALNGIVAAANAASGKNEAVRFLNPYTPAADDWTSSKMLDDLPGGGFDITATTGVPGFKPAAILGSAFDDSIKGARDSTVVDAGAGDDYVKASKALNKPAFWLLGDGDDVFVSDEGFNHAWGGPGDDTFINNYWGGTTFDGGAGNDLLDINTSGRGASKNTIMIGGTGDDTVLGGAQTKDSIYTGAGDDYLSIQGVGFADLGSGNDFLETNGKTFAMGGLGNDTMSVKGKNNKVFFAGGEGDDVLSTGNGGGYLFGGSGNDTLTGAKFADTLAGGDGEDVIYGANGKDVIVLEPGLENIDRVIKLGSDVFDVSAFGIASFEQLQSQITSGSLSKQPGGADYDYEFTISNLNGSVTVQIVEGPNSVGAGRFLYADEALVIPDGAIAGSGQDDVLTLGNNADLVLLGAGDDLISAGKGNDTVYGGAGDDTVYAERGKDIIYADAGDDVVYGGRQDDIIYGGDGADTLAGGKERDVLYGDAGDDLLKGGKNNDTLIGGVGDDTLIGGIGLDTLTGGDGADTFVFTFLKNIDTLTDFNGAEGDRLDFSQIASSAVTEATLADYLRFENQGDDLVIRISPTGANYTFKNVVTLEDTTDISLEYILI